MPQRDVMSTGSESSKTSVDRPTSTLEHQSKTIGPPQTQLLLLQQLAGNRAVGRLLEGARKRQAGSSVLQRCGPIPCGCPPEERAEKDPALSGTIQRFATPTHRSRSVHKKNVASRSVRKLSTYAGRLPPGIPELVTPKPKILLMTCTMPHLLSGAVATSTMKRSRKSSDTLTSFSDCHSTSPDQQYPS
jgi:hypothetical protein